MPGTHKGYTTPHRCSMVNDPKRNQPSDRGHQARCKLQEKVSDFHVQFHGPIYLSIRPEGKRDICNTFVPDRLISVHLDPPSMEKNHLWLRSNKKEKTQYVLLTFTS